MNGVFTPTVAVQVWERDKGRCFLCQVQLRKDERGVSWSLHHRQPRGMGGTSKVMTAAKGMLLCGTGVSGCHGYVESHRAEAMEKGWLISVNSRMQPAEVPVLTVWRTRVLLTDDGRIEEGNWG